MCVCVCASIVLMIYHVLSITLCILSLFWTALIFFFSRNY